MQKKALLKYYGENNRELSIKICNNMEKKQLATSTKGGFPVAISITVHPRDQISAGGP